ncbi:MAG: D-alanyl-D-alanine carboxypeptidase, partial [Miltoncostaeaceae bacterium]
MAQYREETPRIPASNEKLITSAAALISLGPDFRFQTRLFRGVRTTRTGRVLRGPLYVKGYGDPTLATRPFARSVQSGLGGNFARLFLPLRRDGIRAVKGPIVADESFFDQRRSGPRWKSGFSIYSRPLSALSLNRNNLGSPPTPAAVRARAALRGMGIRQTGGVRVGQTPRSATEIGGIASPPLHAILGVTNPASDNYQAEMLMKAVGAYGAGVGTTVAGARRATALLRERGILTL